MRRIGLVILAVALTLAPLAGDAQQAGKIQKIGWLSDGVRSDRSDLQGAFVEGLRDLGYEEGRNVVIERRDAEGRIERLPALATEVVKLGVDVIVTAGGGVPTTNAAKRATSSIPIVMTEAGDPVATGLVASLARPGGNVTGLASMDPDTSRKRLQLLKVVAPHVRRVAILYNPTFPATVLILKEAQLAASTLGVTILPMEARSREELDSAFARMIKSGGDSLLLMGDPFTSNQRRRILDLISNHRLPAISQTREFVESGGLMGYGPSYPEMYRRAATFVDKILKGAKPSDLPVEQPTKFEVIINLKTAKALGLTIPQSILVRADEIIQ